MALKGGLASFSTIILTHMLKCISVVYYFFLLLGGPLYGHPRFAYLCTSDGHLNCLQLLAVTDETSMNIYIQVFGHMLSFS